MMDYQSIIDFFYPDENELRHILITHSQSVARKALQIVALHPEFNLDAEFIEAAAMLHDIGICRCDAPSIACYGSEPYICHGKIGAQMLRDLVCDDYTSESLSVCASSFNEKQLERLARVCERHTGAGLSLDDIIRQQLPLPHQSFLPETIEEQVVCYADKFFSKTHLDREKTIEQAEQSLVKFGTEGVSRFRRWAQMFE